MLQVIQPLSRSIGKVDGAQPGRILNTGTGIISDSVNVIPVYTKHLFVEWSGPIEDPGTHMVAKHEISSPVVAEALKNSKDFGEYYVGLHPLVETFYVYAVTEAGEQIIISFKSTQVKYYKNWMTKAKSTLIQAPDGRRFIAPLFSHVYNLSTFAEERKKGRFHSWRIEFANGNAEKSRLSPDNMLYQVAREFKHVAISLGVGEDKAKQPPTEY